MTIAGLILLAASVPTKIFAQDVKVGAKSIGGVVTSAQRAGGRRLGDRRDHRTADQVRAHRRHRRQGPLSHSRSAGCRLQRLGARLRPGRFAENARQARHASQSRGGDRAERGGGGALLSGDLLVHDDEDSARQRVRRQERYSREVHAERLAQADEQCRLHRLPSARPGIDPHDPGGVRHVQLPAKKPGCAASRRVRPAR